MLNDFLSWWAEQLLALLPARWKRAGRAGRADAIVVFWRPGHIDIVVRREGGEAPVGSFALDEAGLAAAGRVLAQRGLPGAIVLRGAPGQLLERQLALPLAAERDLGRLLGYEMDRLTPFDADEVFWNCAVERRDRTQGKLHLRLSLVARSSVQAAIEALRAIGAAPGWIEAPTAAGELRRIGLAAPDDRRTGNHRAVMLASLVCLALALAVVCLPFVLQSLRLRTLENRIEALRPLVAEVDGLRRRIAGEGAGSDVVAAERARTGDALQVLAAITELLPDDTMLTDFSLSQGKLGLGGRSSVASRLIPMLAGDPLIRNPAFVAPVTRAEDGRADRTPVDRFAIRAELAP